MQVVPTWTSDGNARWDKSILARQPAMELDLQSGARMPTENSTALLVVCCFELEGCMIVGLVCLECAPLFLSLNPTFMLCLWLAALLFVNLL